LESDKILPHSDEIWQGFILFYFILFYFFYLCEPKLVKEELLGREHGVEEEGSLDFAKFWPVFQISPKSLLMVRWNHC
jgi:hypothetical protein